MARPRVFVSSTFYDLKFARAELGRFIQDIGYDSVMNERGQIPYSIQETLEEYCYREINKVNILVAIIGGRFGTQARADEAYSISNMEVKTAISLNKQVYIFVESAVLSEYQTYLRNKDKDITFGHADDPRIYKFIEEVSALKINNQIIPFSNVSDIISHLREQWAGLFEQFLQQESQIQLAQMMEKLHTSTETLNDLVKYFREKPSDDNPKMSGREEILDAITLRNHPVFAALQASLRVNYRLFFTNLKEFEDWLFNARGGKKYSGEAGPDTMNYHEYIWKRGSKEEFLDIAKSLFAPSGELLPMLPGDWQDQYVKVYAPTPRQIKSDDDDIPF